MAREQFLTDAQWDEIAPLLPELRSRGRQWKDRKRPIQSVTKVTEQAGLSIPAAGSAMELLVSLGIARDLTGNRRNRLFAYSRYLDSLTDEAMES